MDHMFHTQQRIGDIVAAFPGASNLFKRYGIDFCCGGGRPLSAALQERGIDEDPFVAELQEAYREAQSRKGSPDIDWRDAPLSALTWRVVTAHHRYLKQEMPLLSAFTAKIAGVHGERHPELMRLHQLFQDFRTELESHMVAEENELFPLVEAYDRSRSQDDLARAVATLEELESEHEAAGQLLASMRAVTGGYSLPPDACRTYTLTFQKLEELESDMFQHIHLENNIMFDRLRKAMA